ncbi:hypothetical protein [Enterobacillus tribolii]|uniref:Uncharacterized protein n=1 Tax=Enterobacillus tribolii TaxID=1487935 RepID=A0A370QLZ1_9GAMM|nr:hypothetical protein [Enterobacillus tribolii]MBW7982205.1 hypothetical protein [Enterobacillus tribolii]RDK89374.1 hypothetical protein C8D90_10725 [Enterobacillus tribolii]
MIRKILAGFMVLILIGWVSVFFIPEMNYRESDFIRYNFFTPSEIKNIPRISDEYHFEYVPEGVDRKSSSSIIRFCNVGNKEKAYETLQAYASKLSIPMKYDYSPEDEQSESVFYVVNGSGVYWASCVSVIFDK